MAFHESPPTDLPTAGEDGFINISDSDASDLVEAGLSFEDSDQVIVHAEHTLLETSLDDLEELGIDGIESAEDPDGDDLYDIMLTLGFEFTGDEESVDRLEELLSGFDAESPLVEDDVNASICFIGQEAGEIDASIVEELSLLGIDYIVGDNDTVIATDSDPEEDV